MSDETKKCSTCGSIFPLTREFYGQQASTGGFRGRCRVCDRDAKARYAENNPDQIQEKWRRQNARRKAAGLPWSQDDVAVIRARLRDRCFYCGVTLFGGGEVDHMTSLAEGGTNEFRNLTLACLPCNRAKEASTPGRTSSGGSLVESIAGTFFGPPRRTWAIFSRPSKL